MKTLLTLPLALLIGHMVNGHGTHGIMFILLYQLD